MLCCDVSWQVFVTLMVSVQYQVKRVLLYEDGPPPAAVS